MKTLKVLLQEVVSGIKAWVNSNFAQESNAVHKTGNETINGDKTLTGTTVFSGNVGCNQNCQFTKTITPSEITGTSDCNLAFNALNNVVFFNTRGSSNYKGYGSFLWTGYNSDTAPDRYGQIQLLRSTDKYGDTNDGRVPDPTFKMWRVATYYNVMDFMESVRIQNINSTNFMIPISDNTTDLGISTSKWKSFNGLNPGALSFPKIVQAQSRTLDRTNWDYTGTNWNTLDTSAMTGWGYIHIEDCGATDFILIRRGATDSGRPTQSANPILNIDGKYHLYITFPIVQNTYVYALIKTSGTVTTSVVYPCQGTILSS